MSELSDLVRSLRDRLVAAGAQSSGHAGEYVLPNDVFVRFGYTSGAYRMTAFLRSGGRSGRHTGQSHYEIRANTSREDAELHVDATLAWKPGVSWPPGGDYVVASYASPVENGETPQAQVDRLARFIAEVVPGEPSRSESAVDAAIRLLRDVHAPSGEVT